MKKKWRWVLMVGSAPLALLAAQLPVWTAAPAGSPVPKRTVEIAEKEQRSCVTCHIAFGRPELNEIGRYYKAEGTLEGYPGELPPREGQPAPQREPEPAPEPPPARGASR